MIIDENETIFCPIIKAECKTLVSIRSGNFDTRCVFGTSILAEKSCELFCDLADIAFSLAESIREDALPPMQRVWVENAEDF